MVLTAPKVFAVVTERLERELALVEARFSAELVSDLPCVNELVTHVERYRGKMLRPSLVLTSAMVASGLGEHAAGEPDGGQSNISEAHRTVAAVVEMIHMATLVHDDVLDEAQMRRQGRTVNDMAGNETAVMLGDYLFSHAYHLVSGLDQPTIARVLCEATNTVCEGELLQLANRNNWELDEPTYFQIIRRKTAALCGVSCRVGAMLSGATGRLTEALADYGMSLGVAFQIIDDLLDLTGDPAVVGKSLGRDLYKGKLTLPLIHHLHVTRQQQGRLAKALRELPPDAPAVLDGELLQEVPQLLAATQSLDYARQRARQCVTAACNSLDELPPGLSREFLQQVAEAVVTRKS